VWLVPIVSLPFEQENVPLAVSRKGRLSVHPWAFEVFAVTRLTKVMDVRTA
jgi:hypothetical protein